jgi:hypothetical protein
LHELLAQQYGSRWPALAQRFRQAVGATPEAWLVKDFFGRHVVRFRRRPVAWQLSSRPQAGGKPAFSCLVHCQSAARIAALGPEYVEPLIAALERQADSGRQLAELRDFAARLAGLTDYNPHPDYGVRVNIAPLQHAGVLARDVLPAAEQTKALDDYRRWREYGFY